MQINHIIVLKETREGEGRVALTPNTVAQLCQKKFSVMVESQAGQLAGFNDSEYLQAGANIFRLGENVFPSESLILRVKRPIKSREQLENKLFSKSTIMIGFLDPFDVDHENHLSKWRNLGVVPLSLELLDLKADDPRNAQAAMSRFAGKLALQDALKRYQGSLPKKVTIIGTGPAALNAASEARRDQLSVQIFGRQERYRQMIEAEGIQYHVLPADHQTDFIRPYLKDQTILITAARDFGNRSPLLIDQASLTILPEKTVIIDLASGEGGNVVGSREDAVVNAERGISIVNVSGYPKLEPQGASEAFAQCMVNLLLDIMTEKKEIQWDHPVLKPVLNFKL